jgi:uncharacterized circularly permuted ATP-grasp superfamily protein/uncharacterized alpha-E superfamily protein
LFEEYTPSADIFDEMAEDTATPRSHWRPLIESLQKLGQREIALRWENGRRIIREHGVTYNVYGDPQGMDRPWGLDLMPLLISVEDWAHLEAGLIQRTRLFNLILADIYGGGQRLLRDGFLPPELVYANSGFLRPCRGIAAVKHVYLHLHACDLARSADGTWWVLADRTQAPSGAGYALENRTVISRVLPDEIRDQNVRRLAGFFNAQRDMLLNLSPGSRGMDEPSVVLLTPGPHNETYFEHAYLARHLGFPLVEGEDLTVRDRRVFLKTLEGLQPVDVILRRVDDSFCDPLELRGESFLGVAGLVDATRAGNVTLANALGTGLMESPALLAFLPGLCRHLLGEELIIPSVATWWCGQGDEQRYVLEHFDELVIKQAFGAPNRQPWFGGRLSRTEKAQLLALVQARPRDFVGQERVVLSHAPVWADNRVEARSIVVRSYVANGGDSFAVLPGGLTRVSRTAEDPLVSMQSGGGSKDTWVLANGGVSLPDAEHVTHLLGEAMEGATAVSAEIKLPTCGERSRTTAGAAHEPAAKSDVSPVLGAAPAALSRGLSGVPSRAADNLFWLGRYTERLEQTLRTLRCVLGRLSDESAREGSPELAALGELLAGLEFLRLSPGFKRQELQQQVLHLVYKPDITGSVHELLGRIKFIASTVRDRFSGDTWRILGRLDQDGRSRPGRLALASATGLIHNLVFDLAAFNGMEMENMTRGHGWRFLDAGRRVERSQSVVNLLRAAVNVAVRPALILELVLEIADSVMTYRRRYYSEVRLPSVLDLLLRDRTNPRSLSFQLETLHRLVIEFPRNDQGPGPIDELQKLLSLAAILQETKLEDLTAREEGSSEPLVNLLTELITELAVFSDALNEQYFTHTVARVSQL